MHNPAHEQEAVRRWRERHSLVSRLRSLWLTDPARARALAVHMERWGWPGLAILEDIAAIPPAPCADYGGRGLFDDIVYPTCVGRGVR